MSITALFLYARCSAVQCNLGAYYFKNINGGAVSDLTTNPKFPNKPDETVALSGAFETANRGDNYGTMIETFINAPTTGKYTFNVDSDDASEVWVSSTPNASSPELRVL